MPDGVVEAPSDLSALIAMRCPPIASARWSWCCPKPPSRFPHILRYAAEAGVPVVPRGAGTSLSGGALPRADGILIGMGRMSRILEIDYENRCVIAGARRHQSTITRAVEAEGFYYAPDPSSQIACTIGGNVAENSAADCIA